MGEVVRIADYRRPRRAVQERQCDRCTDPAYEGGLCAGHFALCRAEQEDHRARMEREIESGERCGCCRMPIAPRSSVLVLGDVALRGWARVFHRHCVGLAGDAAESGEIA